MPGQRRDESRSPVVTSALSFEGAPPCRRESPPLARSLRGPPLDRTLDVEGASGSRSTDALKAKAVDGESGRSELGMGPRQSAHWGALAPRARLSGTFALRPWGNFLSVGLFRFAVGAITNLDYLAPASISGSYDRLVSNSNSPSGPSPFPALPRYQCTAPQTTLLANGSPENREGQRPRVSPRVAPRSPLRPETLIETLAPDAGRGSTGAEGRGLPISDP